MAATRTLPADEPQTPLGRRMLEQQEKINSYHWVNREAEVRAIPIDRAMELVAQEMAAHRGPPRNRAEKREVER